MTNTLTQTYLDEIRACLRVVPDYPSKGINFRDIQPLLSQPHLLDFACQMLASKWTDVTCVGGLDARGFIFGSLIAQKLGVGFVMLRKPAGAGAARGSKLPGETHSVSYGLEYGKNVLHVQKDAINNSDKVLIVDDILVTGGSVEAACKLVEMCGAKVAGVCCLADVVLPDGADCSPRERLAKHTIHTLLTFKDGDDTLTAPVRAPTTNIQSPPSPGLLASDDQRAVILYYPSMEDIAREMVASHPAHFRLGHVQWSKFPDGTPNIKFEPMSKLENRDVVYLGSLYDTASCVPQLSLVSVLPRQHIRSLQLVFPYFAFGTMERVEEEGILATAETFARILSASIPMCQRGPATLRIYDIHALPNRFYFGNSVNMRMQTAIDVLLKEISRDSTTIAFPDDGAYKRFRHSFEGFPMVVCSKIRDGDKRTVRITETIGCRPNYLETDQLLIVDDLVQSGGTLDECRRALVAEGAKNVSAYVTHAIFPNDDYPRFFSDSEKADRRGFTKFYITNSVPEVAQKLEGYAPFHVLHLGEHLASDIVKFIKSPKHPLIVEADVLLASTSEVKAKSLRHAIDTVTRNLRKTTTQSVVFVSDSVTTIADTQSLVPSQPFGNQTTVGALNRLKTTGISARSPYNAKPVVAIESGIFRDHITQRWYDQAVILVKSVDGTVHTIRSNKVVIPDEYMKEWFETRGNEDAPDTVGKIFANRNDVPHDDWHRVVSPYTRQQVLVDALTKAAPYILQLSALDPSVLKTVCL